MDDAQLQQVYQNGITNIYFKVEFLFVSQKS